MDVIYLLSLFFIFFWFFFCHFLSFRIPSETAYNSRKRERERLRDWAVKIEKEGKGESLRGRFEAPSFASFLSFPLLFHYPFFPTVFFFFLMLLLSENESVRFRGKHSLAQKLNLVAFGGGLPLWSSIWALMAAFSSESCKLYLSLSSFALCCFNLEVSSSVLVVGISRHLELRQLKKKKQWLICSFLWSVTVAL